MDEQNPRMTGSDMTGRGGEMTRGLDPEAANRPATPETATSSYVSSSPAGTRHSGAGDRTGREETEPRTRELRAEIEHTRGEMTETVNAIQERLRPSNLAANAKEAVKATAMERARDVSESEPVQYVRANPIATAMIGIGLAGVAMLAFGGRESRSNGRGRRSGRRDWRTTSRWRDDASAEYRTGYRELERSAYPGYESAESYTPGMSPPASTTGRDWSAGRSGSDEPTYREALEREWRSGRTADARHYLQRTWEENPLVIGAATAVIGALVGLAVPETERENQLMGPARDNAVQAVQDTVREKVSQAKEVATDAVNTLGGNS